MMLARAVRLRKGRDGYVVLRKGVRWDEMGRDGKDLPRESEVCGSSWGAAAVVMGVVGCMLLVWLGLVVW